MRPHRAGWTASPSACVGNYDLARDGKRLVIVEGSSDDMRVTRELRVIFNWVEDLKRRLPAH